LEAADECTHKNVTLYHPWAGFVVGTFCSQDVRGSDKHSACGTAVYKIPLQYHFFEEADFSGRGAWYYIWQQ